jgi:hypothetical protein
LSRGAVSTKEWFPQWITLGCAGCTSRTPDPPATGTFIQLLLDVPTGEVRALAAVQRSSAKQGMGVKFVAMEKEDRARFAGWLKTLSCPSPKFGMGLK